MDTRLVRVVCASCDANYRIPSDGVRGKVVDYCCSNCGAVIEVDGTAIEMVAPTRPGQDPRDRLPRTPEPSVVAPSDSAFRVSTPTWRSDTPAGLVRVKPPPPPTEAFSARRPPPVHSSMPPAMSMPPRDVAEVERSVQLRSDVPPLGDTPIDTARRPQRKGWMALATLVAAVAVAFIGRAIGSLAGAPPSTAPAAAAEPPTPVTARLQPGDFKGMATDPAQSSAPTVQARSGPPSEISVESLKAEKRRKKAKSLKTTGADEPEPVAEEAAAEPAAPPAPTFVAPEPPPPAGPEFNLVAAQSALEDAAALAATCRQEDTTAGSVRIAVTFVPSGQATVAIVESGVVRGTPVGSCVAAKFRTAKVPPFSGTKVTVHKTMSF